MALSNVPESDSFDTNVQMPADGDAADASDFQASTIRPLVNRSRWLHTRLNPLWAGGTIAPTGNVVFDLGGGGITFQGDDDYNIILSTGVQLFANGRMAGPMFTAGRSGNANKKPATPVSGGGPYDIDPSTHDVFDFTPNSAIVVNIDTSPDFAYADGYTFRVINRATTLGYTIAIKRDSGAVTVFTLAPGVAGGASFVDIMHRAGAWSEIGSNRLA